MSKKSMTKKSKQELMDIRERLESVNLNPGLLENFPKPVTT